MERLVISTVGSQPSRGFWNNKDERDDGDDENRLEGNGDPPSFASGHRGESVPDPIGDKDTAVEERKLEADESTSVRLG